MKYMNYLILLMVFWCVVAWIFNHVSAIVGVLVLVGGCYLFAWKLIKLIKEKCDV